METYDKTPALLLEYMDSPQASSNVPFESSLISITNETFSSTTTIVTYELSLVCLIYLRSILLYLGQVLPVKLFTSCLVNSCLGINILILTFLCSAASFANRITPILF